MVRSHPLLKDVPVPDRLGSPASGGAILTGGGLIFIGGGDRYLYAFDRNDGRELWRGRCRRRPAVTRRTFLFSCARTLSVGRD